jgi:L-ascorbate metabolism protein UlaG (beta-lactamase superfamily)
MKMALILTIMCFATTLLILACTQRVGALRQSSTTYSSKNFKGGRFQNLASTRLNTNDGNMVESAIDFFRGSPDRVPANELPAVLPALDEKPENKNLRVTWFGHSTCLVQIDGQTLLTDPVFGDRASPFSFVGPKRFPTEIDFRPQDLPEKIDAVLISHDHYDHLDRPTIQALEEKVDIFYVPLGVAAHLLAWGIAEGRVIELDWWEEISHGPLTLAATPSQHFSGRGLTSRNKTLWASWVVIGTRERFFFSGDSGYFDGFTQIGDTYGPFDLTMLESGAYNEAWADVHMMPEETVQAHQDLRGDILLPVHWAKFNLALHPWQEPIQRLLNSAGAHSVEVLTPRIGESFYPGEDRPQRHWWNESQFENVIVER